MAALTARRPTLVAATTLCLLIAACSPARLSDAIDVLEDVVAGAGPSTLKDTTPEPQRRSVALTGDVGAVAADLYEPGDPAAAGLVLVPGATRLGARDPRVVDLAQTLARARFEVIVPHMPGLTSFRFDSADAMPISAAANYLETRAEGRPLGVAAVSFGVGPAVLALLETDAVDFAVLIGGYYDITEAVTFVTTGWYRDAPGAPWRRGEPEGLAKWAFVLANLDQVTDVDDRALLQEAAERRMARGDADVADLVRRFGPEARAVWALMANDDPEQTPALIAALSPTINTEIAHLDLSQRDLSGLDVAFVLIHGRDDPAIPASQSRALARALGTDRSDLFVVDALRHVKVARPGLVDSLSLLGAVYRVLELRDGA